MPLAFDKVTQSVPLFVNKYLFFEFPPPRFFFYTRVVKIFFSTLSSRSSNLFLGPLERFPFANINVALLYLLAKPNPQCRLVVPSPGGVAVRALGGGPGSMSYRPRFSLDCLWLFLLEAYYSLVLLLVLSPSLIFELLSLSLLLFLRDVVLTEFTSQCTVSGALPFLANKDESPPISGPLLW